MATDKHTRRFRSANIGAVIAVALWGYMLYVGIELLKGVESRVGTNYSEHAGQVLIGPPVVAISAVVLAAVVSNLLNRFWEALGNISLAVCLALPPYLFVYGGGM